MIETRRSSPPHSLAGTIARSVMSQRSAERRLELAKIWLALSRRRSLELCRLPARLSAAADVARIQRLTHAMADIVDCDPESAAKYVDYNYWIPFNVARIGKLRLYHSRPLRILDIGCGPGYFMAAALACGHDCYGIDAPAGVLTEVEARVYSEMLAALSCSDRVTSGLIERFRPMAVPVRDLDLITAFWICFNRHQQPGEWGAEEWRFWVEDALTYLRDGGVLHLELNSNPQRYRTLEWYDQETLDYFRSAGKVQRNVVRIVKGKPPEWKSD
ncbi:MAG TPA: class I SAM-dependent methyltransferase [Candidatus Bathyarchaeia archaeon]|nr:class I SAM-dependent methyltransferase [Candidatus Bathyarchaeia archaeon]